ncbi:unnamed protein product [Ilex paraguariensis]|uniref:GDT1 family protein n=1 Tax=Ilex paraguariensis TaxID=185542 RepID=A0ABC8TSH2_9AQUA
MRSTTLSSESVLLRATNPLPLSYTCSKPFKFFNFRRNSLLFHRTPSLFLSRYSGWQCINKDDGRFRHSSCSDCPNLHDQELMFLNCNSGKAVKVVYNMNDCSTSDKSSAKDYSRKKNHIPADVPVLDTPFFSYLKFALFCGFFTLQGTQQAVASSDFASGFQSISFLEDLGDFSTGFASAFLLIFFSELGDKTFFIAALLAARNSAAVVFIGTFGALGVMTTISVVIGRTFHYVDDILPFRFGDADLPIDDIAAVCLLVYFGVSTLLEATSSDSQRAEDEQKEAELAVSELSGDGAGILAAANTIISTFLLVFVAEWGDKSFFSTIALAAASSPLGVIGGALAGHGVATLLAVLGGSLLGTFLSEKVIAYMGGTLFLIFAAVTLAEIVT